jgi:DNA-binding YbaB/EbfC family protein
MENQVSEDFNKMFERLHEVQEQMARVQAELATIEAKGDAGGAMVTATVSGQQRLIRIKIDKEVIDPNDPEILEDLVVAAVNRALDNSRELAEQKMAEVTRGFMPPGIS